MLGLYLHIPFCDGKCPYCDFYSLAGDEALKEAYTRSLEKQLVFWAQKLIQKGVPPVADTLYFGGGTPNLLGAERISRLIKTAKQNFSLENAEITVEVNPSSRLDAFLQTIFSAGANRLSIGLQSANDEELKILGRRHTARQAAETVQAARRAGFSNLSLDLMLATPGQTMESALDSVKFCAELKVPHVSAYLLKVEPGTSYWNQRESLSLPDEDETADRYLAVCDALDKVGLKQYEVSNFSFSGKESRHNLKYWHCEEYLGLGPGAHSFVNGKRFYYPRSLNGFLDKPEPIEDGEGGTLEEKIMLGLRLREGITWETLAGFGEEGRKAFSSMEKKSRIYRSAGLLVPEPARIAMTPKGFLVSNELIAELLPETV